MARGFRPVRGMGAQGPADYAGLTRPVPPMPDPGSDVGAPIGDGTFGAGAQQPPGGMATGWWHWARKLLSSTALRSVQLPLPEAQQIPDSYYFEQISFVTTSAAGLVQLPGTQLQLKAGQEARISEVAIFMAGAGGGSLTQTNYATFSIRVDGSPVPGWGNISTFPRVAVSVQENFDAYIRVAAGRSIDAIANNTDGGTYVVGLFYTGWLWSTQAGKKWLTGLSPSQS